MRLISTFLGFGLATALAFCQTVEPETTRLEPLIVPAKKISTAQFLPQINSRVSVRLRQPRNKHREPLPYAEPNTLPFGGLLDEPRGNELSRFPAIGFTGMRPPDPYLAVGQNHIVAVVNSSLAYYSKTGTPLFEQDFDTFFASLYSQSQDKFIFDPKVIYDRHADRFVVLAIDQSNAQQRSRILVGVSDDGNPTGNWFLYAIDVKATISGVACWGDYPGFGYNKDGYGVALNMFSFTDSFRGVQIVTIRKIGRAHV